jgi:photosystem II stability/assembly factor-like uncharacterized protein
MKKFSILLIALVWMTGANCQWFPLYLSDTLVPVSIYFTDANTGYVSINNTVDYSPAILKTIDGGTNWIQQFSCFGNVVIGPVFFPDTNTGYAIIDYAPWPYGSDDRLLKTSNGGENWEIVYDFQYPVASIFFTDINIGYAVGGNGPNEELMSKTIDGGLSWTTQTLPGGIASLFFVDANIGYGVAGTYSFPQHRTILKTTNGGTDWITILDEQDNALCSVFFISADTGYAAGYNVILKTVDGGLNWDNLQTGTYGCSFNSIYFTDKNTGYAVGGDFEGLIIKTKDAGLTWFAQEIVGAGYLEQLTSVFFPVSDTGYIAGYNILLKTTNGGGLPVGLINQKSDDFSVSIFPNPSSNQITIETAPSENILSTELTDLQGRLIKKQDFGSGSKTVMDVYDVPKGLYLVKIISDKNIYSNKVIID